MGRPTKIRNAANAQDFRDAVVERMKQIHRKVRPLPQPECPDEPVTPRVSRPRGAAPGRFSEDHVLGRRSFFDNDDDD